jgi:hypothetical protein
MKRILILSVLSLLLVSPAALACGDQASAKAAASHDCPATMQGVERAVTSLDNGVRLQMTSGDPAVVKALQAKMNGCPKSGGCSSECMMSNKAWARKVENTDNGVVLTLTADSAAEVQKIQAAAAVMAKGGCPHDQAGEKGGCPHHANKQADKA